MWSCLLGFLRSQAAAFCTSWRHGAVLVAYTLNTVSWLRWRWNKSMKDFLKIRSTENNNTFLRCSSADSNLIELLLQFVFHTEGHCQILYFTLNKTCQPHGGTRGKAWITKRRLVGFSLWGLWMFVPNSMAIHPTAVKLFHPEPRTSTCRWCSK